MKKLILIILTISCSKIIDIKTKDINENLLIAIIDGNKNEVECLIERGVNIDDKDDEGRTPLMIASRNGHKEVVELLLEKGVNINNKDNEGWTSLIIASHNGYKELVELLLEKGANINDKNNNGWTGLVIASKNGHKGVVKILLERGGNINDKDNEGWTALIIASRNVHKGIVRILLEKGANISDKNNKGWTALIIASRNGHKGVVKILLERGANINDKNNNGWTALMLASKNGHKEVVELLIEKGANINNKQEDGWTALMTASQDGRKEVARLLLERGANINDKQEDGWTALMIASKNDHKEVVELLIEKEANINDKNNNGWTALIIASHNGYKEVVELLIEKGANINDKQEDGWTTLMITSKNGNKVLVELLIEKGANINDKNNNGWTALMLASKDGHKEVIELLLEKGANINDKDIKGRTALIHACKGGRNEIIKLLIKEGAGINCEDYKGNTALFYILNKKNLEIATFLLSKGADIDNTLNEELVKDIIIYNIEKDVNVAYLLLSKYKDKFNYDEVTNNTLIHWCMDYDHKDILKKMLLDKNNRFDLSKEELKKLILYSIRTKEIKLSFYLANTYREKLNFDYLEANRTTLALWSASQGCYEIIKLLINDGINIDKRSKEGEALVSLAFKVNHFEITKLLIEKGFKYKVANRQMKSLILWSIKNNYVDFAISLIDKHKNRIFNKINFNFKDKEGNTLLHYACMLDSEKLILLLLECKAHINKLNKLGQSPLYFAISRDDINQNIAKLLISKGAMLKPSSYIKEKALIDILLPYEELCNTLIFEPFSIKIFGNTNLNSEDYDKLKEIIKILKIKNEDFEKNEKMISFIRNVLLNNSFKINLSNILIDSNNQDVELNIKVFDEIFMYFREDDYWGSIREKGIDNVKLDFKNRLLIIEQYKPVNKSLLRMNMEERLQSTNFQRKKKLAYLLRLISKAAKNGYNNDKIKFVINQILDIVSCTEGSLEAINDAVRYLSEEENSEIKDIIDEELMNLRYNILKEICINRVKIREDGVEEIMEITPHTFPQLVKEMSQELRLKVEYLDDKDYNLIYNKDQIVLLTLNKYKELIIGHIRDKVESNKLLWNKVRDYIERDIFQGRAILQIDDFIYDESYKIKKEAIKALLIHFNLLIKE